MTDLKRYFINNKVKKRLRFVTGAFIATGISKTSPNCFRSFIRLREKLIKYKKIHPLVTECIVSLKYKK